jgi:5-methylcytosine-specific restriction endonuclease McrA
VKREVWKRDRGRCQWPIVGKDGDICSSTLRVEFDHVVPRARDGPSSVEGVRLLCAFHNNLAARQAFGDRFMDRYSRGGRR